MSKLSSICIFFFVMFLFSCSEKQRNSKDIHQNGRIKFTTCFGYDAVEKKGEIPRDSIVTKATFNYDKKGNLIEANYYNLETNSVFSKDQRFYDDSSNMVKIIFYNRNGEVSGYDIYKYDDKNNEIQKDNYWEGNLNGKLTTNYDYKNMIVTVCAFDKNGNLQSRNSYKTDKRGNEIENYDSDGKLYSKASFIYDNKGNIIKENSEAWEMDTTNYEVIYNYDKYNNEIFRTVTDLNTKTVSSVKTEFTYDKFGNWTKKVTTWSWTTTRETSTREIEYFED